MTKLILAQKEHREHLRSRSKDSSSAVAPAANTLPSVPADDNNPFVGICSSDIFNHRLHTDLDSSCFSTVSLDADEYLTHDVNSICEATLLSIRSDICRSPASLTYDMTIPPSNYHEAMLCSDAADWARVVNKELNMLKTMGVYVEEILPEGCKAIGNRWVFKFKLSVDNSPPTHKGHLVAHRFSQIPFINYANTFAPVTKSVTIRLIAIYAVARGWELNCFDATHVFLWGDLSEEIYMRRPTGFTSTLPNTVWHLRKSLYGLKQASRIWYLLLHDVLGKLGFKRSEFDHALFIFHHSWDGSDVHCLLAMHVDDGTAGCNSKLFLVFIKSEIGKAFGIKDLSPVKTFLGVQFE